MVQPGEKTMEMTTEEERLMREEVGREVFGGEAPVEEIDESRESESEAEETEVDQWTGVAPALRQTLESLQARMADLDTLNSRLKQAESRIGGAERRLHEAKVAAQQVDDKPSAEQVKKAAQTAEKWQSLKEDFPEWADVLDETRSELTAKTAELAGKIPDVESIRGSINEEVEAKVDAVRKEMAIEAVRAIHDDLDEIKASPQFIDWVKKQPQDIVAKLGSWKPSDAIKVLNSYKAYLGDKKSPKSISQERQNRLESAAADNRKTGKPIKQKSLDDMSDDEYRRHVAREIFK
jgi:chromosome segregation ATPase